MRRVHGAGCRTPRKIWGAATLGGEGFSRFIGESVSRLDPSPSNPAPSAQPNRRKVGRQGRPRGRSGGEAGFSAEEGGIAVRASVSVTFNPVWRISAQRTTRRGREMSGARGRGT